MLVNNLIKYSGQIVLVVTAIALSGCKSTEKQAQKAERSGLFGFGKKKESQTPPQLAFNGGSMGDPQIKRDVNGAIERAQKKVASQPGGLPRQNQGVNLPSNVDISRAKSVTYSSVKVDGPYLAITFDDGPHPTNTPRLLDMLAERNIKATFFVVAPFTKSYPHLIQRMIAEGHEIGNHTVNHPTNMSRLPKDRVRAEMSGCESAIIGSGGRKPRLMRPPGGSINSEQKVWINDEYNYKTILWSCDPEDWKKPGVSVVANRLIAGARPGAILLAHDLHASTVAAMPQTLDGILAKGFRFVTVSQLIAMENNVADVPANANAPEKIESPEHTVSEPQPLPGETILPAALVEPEEESSPVNPG